MRRRTIAEFGLVLGLLASLATAAWAQPVAAPRRPQAKIITFEPVKETSAVVGVIGQVGRPGTYQFASAPTLDLVIAAAGRMTPDASEMVRLVRGDRVVQSAAYASAAQERLQSGDLLIVDAQPTPSGGARPAEKNYVWLAFVGVQERPLIVACPLAHAHPDLIVQKLGQPNTILPSVRVLPPPSAALPKQAGTPLPDSTVLFFDRSLIQVHDLPNDLPPVLPCGLPEQPDIGGYGVRNAYEERLQSEGMPSRQQEFPQRDLLIPAPNRDRSEPTPIPLPEDPAPTISSTKQPAGSPNISTVPYSHGPAPISARRHRLTGLEPSQQSTAIDTRSPSWKKEPATAIDELADNEIDENDSPRSAAGALSIWQMLTILSSAAVLVGIALAIRALQTQRSSNNNTSGDAPSHAPPARPATGLASVHAEANAAVPPPHLPPKSFLATAVPRTHAPAETDERTRRQQAFAELLNHQLPIFEEPLALRPGIPLGSPALEQEIWRRDAGVTTIEPADASRMSPPPASKSTARQHLDAPHPRLSTGPHLRIGPEAPVERALRQLHGGRS